MRRLTASLQEAEGARDSLMLRLGRVEDRLDRLWELREEDLEIRARIGAGGFSVVHAGRWQGSSTRWLSARCLLLVVGWWLLTCGPAVGLRWWS